MQVSCLGLLFSNSHPIQKCTPIIFNAWPIVITCLGLMKINIKGIASTSIYNSIINDGVVVIYRIQAIFSTSVYWNTFHYPAMSAAFTGMSTRKIFHFNFEFDWCHWKLVVLMQISAIMYASRNLLSTFFCIHQCYFWRHPNLIFTLIINKLH